MIDYFKHIFTTPEYQLSTLDRFMQIFIVFIGIAIIFGIIFCVALLIEKIKKNRRKKKNLKGKVETKPPHQHEAKGEQYANKRTNK